MMVALTALAQSRGLNYGGVTSHDAPEVRRAFAGALGRWASLAEVGLSTRWRGKRDGSHAVVVPPKYLLMVGLAA
jgi:hypothetical protein